MKARKGIGRRLVLAAGLGTLAACAPVPEPRGHRSARETERTVQQVPGSVEDWSRELLEAAGAGDADAAARLLGRGAEVDVRDGEGRSPLMLAALADHVAAARVLVEYGADPDARDDLGDTPWVTCGVTGSVAMMHAILDAGPDLEVPNRRGGSPLHPASERGHADYVREVLAATGIAAYIDRVNYNGWTALLEAVALGDGGGPHQEIAALLLDAGADASIRDRNGRTALDHARERGYGVIADLLENVR
ncbi:ankyrin repeat domain-containing protein [Glycomyces sp. NPDC047010]|uniref:ankyrin repeat domain-containing protein n=1 Tax=Glycomyces sp. NPDC047010 TaxID=3155023 RepID=UPI0033FC6B7F